MAEQAPAQFNKIIFGEIIQQGNGMIACSLSPFEAVWVNTRAVLLLAKVSL